MHSPFWTISTAAVCVAVAQASSLEDVCTSAYAVAALPAANFYQGITIDNASVTANPVYAANASGNVMFPDSTFDYCNISFAYSHDGIEGDKVRLVYWLPSPDDFKDRFLSTGGGGYLISSGDGLSGSLPGGIIYGAAAGTTDAGFGSLSTQFSSVFLLANGTANFHNLNMFGFQAIHEMTVLGKEFTKGFFNMTKDDKLYAYYQGCSEGGRDGWSQIQRYGDQFDGAVVGAPAFRFAFQQVQHAYSDIVEQTLDYYPPPCEMEKILNETITACDPLDGKTDGVVARTDLCKLHFNTSSLIGTPYSCAASPVYMGFPPHPAWPAQNGTVTTKAVRVADTIIQGLRDSHGKQAYLSYQPASIFADAFTQYDTNTSSFTLWPSDFAAQFVLPFLDLVNATSFANLDNVTYDTLKQWMYQGWQMYESTLHTTWPDLSSYHSSGGKILHYHGESDFSIPTASSVHYRDSVREIMYPHLSFNASNSALNDWYRLFLIPGAGHCGLNAYQPNHPFPQTNLQVMIEWVEKGIVPQTLNSTVLQGDRKGENEQVCAWPLRPSWSKSGNGSVECRFDSKSLETWEVEFDAFKMPVY